MKKNARKKTARKQQSVPAVLGAPQQLSLPEILISTAVGLRDLVVNSGFRVFEALLEAEREALCGPRYSPRQEGQAYRHGFDEGQVVFGGRKVGVRKPRVRTVDGHRELALPSWQRFQDEDPLEERVVQQILAGVSTRNYARSLEPVEPALDSRSDSASSVSRRFVARTESAVGSFLTRSLKGQDYPIIMIDGTGLGDHVAVVVLGIDPTGKKQVLGVAEGSTEASAVCHRLLSELIERGLVVERARLFVIDGGKGIRKAIRDVFSSWAMIQRCQIHKLRNIVEHLPSGRQAWVSAALRRAWGKSDVAKARKVLKTLASQLRENHPGAAASVEEGLEETLTIIALGTQGDLRRVLSSTNVIENLQGGVKRVARNVKRWRTGSMALRWAVTGLMESEKKFRRIRGHRDLAQLIKALEAKIEESKLDNPRKVA
jgi:transposase-like protein